MPTTEPLKLINDLLARSSISPDDQGCQQVIAKILQSNGFDVESLDKGEVKNLWAKKNEGNGPLLLFAGHTDVVPPGDHKLWRFDPFTPTIDQGYLYARGSADMKVALACMVLAAERFVQAQPQHSLGVGFLITSCEELTSDDGTKYVIDQLIQQRHEPISMCVVGEASSNQMVADQIKVGRRGSLSGELTVDGKQGHVAYPELALNPIHRALRALDQLVSCQWDKGNQYFSPTSLQISNIHAGTGANNVIPANLKVSFNFRYSPESMVSQLKQRTEQILNAHQLQFSIDWSHSGEPFLTQPGALITATQAAILQVTGKTAALSTSGGTSDGRFIAPYGVEVIELGFCNKTIHQVDECVEVAAIEKLINVYYQLLVCCNAQA